jgi:flagellar biosynthesis GTPase FlhF
LELEANAVLAASAAAAEARAASKREAAAAAKSAAVAKVAAERKAAVEAKKAAAEKQAAAEAKKAADKKATRAEAKKAAADTKAAAEAKKAGAADTHTAAEAEEPEPESELESPRTPKWKPCSFDDVIIVRRCSWCLANSSHAFEGTRVFASPRRRKNYSCGSCGESTLACKGCETGMAKKAKGWNHDKCRVCAGSLEAWPAAADGTRCQWIALNDVHVPYYAAFEPGAQERWTKLCEEDFAQLQTCREKLGVLQAGTLVEVLQTLEDCHGAKALMHTLGWTPLRNIHVRLHDKFCANTRIHFKYVYAACSITG